MESSKLINYLTNMCQSDEGIIRYFERALTSVGRAGTSYTDYWSWYQRTNHTGTLTSSDLRQYQPCTSAFLIGA